MRPTSTPTTVPLGLNVKEIDRATANRLKLPNGVSGVVVARIDPLSAGHDAGIQRDHILMEISTLRDDLNKYDRNRVVR